MKNIVLAAALLVVSSVSAFADMDYTKPSMAPAVELIQQNAITSMAPAVELPQDGVSHLLAPEAAMKDVADCHFANGEPTGSCNPELTTIELAYPAEGERELIAPNLRLGENAVYRDRYGKRYYVEPCPFQSGLYKESALCVQAAWQEWSALKDVNTRNDDVMAYLDALVAWAGFERRLDLLSVQIEPTDLNSKDLLTIVDQMRSELPGMRVTMTEWKTWLDTPVNARTSG